MAQQQPSLSLLTSSLTALSLPRPTPSFLTPILTSNRTPPLAVLTATAKHRLLSASITSSPTTPSILLSSTPSFPPTICDVRVQERLLSEDVFVQVMDIQDLGRSKWEQIEALEAERKGETTKGREIIRVVPVEGGGGGGGEEGEEGPSTAARPLFRNQNNVQGSGSASANWTADRVSRGPFKLLLQDWKGLAVWGFELTKVEKIGLPPVMGIGCKLLLRKGAKVARGVVLLEPSVVVVFGGKIDAEDKLWRTGREARLRREVTERGDGNRDGGG